MKIFLIPFSEGKYFDSIFPIQFSKKYLNMDFLTKNYRKIGSKIFPRKNAIKNIFHFLIAKMG
jgi:hypothetical protein